MTSISPTSQSCCKVLSSSISLFSFELYYHFIVHSTSNNFSTFSSFRPFQTYLKLKKYFLQNFVMSRNSAVTYTLFGYFWFNLSDFQYFVLTFGNFCTYFEQILTAFTSRFSVNGSDVQ